MNTFLKGVFFLKRQTHPQKTPHPTSQSTKQRQGQRQDKTRQITYPPQKIDHAKLLSTYFKNAKRE